MYNGTMYMPDSKGNVFAFDAVTGERLWYYKPKYPKGFAAGPADEPRRRRSATARCSWPRPTATSSASTSRPAASPGRRRSATTSSGTYFTQPADVLDGTLYHRHVGRRLRRQLQGRRDRRDHRQGQVDVRRDPAWERSSARRRGRRTTINGGGAVWAPLAIDPALGLVYVGVGNPIPYNGIDRGHGKELFTESVVALHTDTGKLAWYFQEVHHDIWDYDTAANPLVLFDLQIKRPECATAIASMGKTGWIYELDRATGKPVLGITEKKVPQYAPMHTSPTQPIPMGQPFASAVRTRRRGRSGRRRTASPSRSAASSRRTRWATTPRSRRPLSAAPTGLLRATARRRATCTSARRTRPVPGRRCRR